MTHAQGEQIVALLTVVAIILFSTFALIMLHVVNHWKDR